MGETKSGKFVCAVCGAEFLGPRTVARKTCSKACQYKYFSATQRNPSKTVTTACPQCGVEFSYYASWPRTYCSHVCSGRATIGNIVGFAPSRFNATCETCGAIFETTPAASRGRFCSQKCFGRWQSANIRGATHPITGRKFGRPERAGPIITKACGHCGKSFTTKRSHLARRRFCSLKCRAAVQGLTWVGPANPGWTGGYEPYYGPSWARAKRAVRIRDGVCRECGKSPMQLGRALDVHHLIPFKRFGRERHAEANRLTNLIALCNQCHLRMEWATNRGVHTA